MLAISDFGGDASADLAQTSCTQTRRKKTGTSPQRTGLEIKIRFFSQMRIGIKKLCLSQGLSIYPDVESSVARSIPLPSVDTGSIQGGSWCGS
jgi:hypothetical protein